MAENWEDDAATAPAGRNETLRNQLKRINLSEKTLKMFERTFGCYIMESEQALSLRREGTAIEGTLEAARNTMTLGATIDGKFEEMSSVGLRNKMRTDAKEDTRKACWEGLRKIGDFVVENGFVELVMQRNRMARTKAVDAFRKAALTVKSHTHVNTLATLHASVEGLRKEWQQQQVAAAVRAKQHAAATARLATSQERLESRINALVEAMAGQGESKAPAVPVIELARLPAHEL